MEEFHNPVLLDKAIEYLKVEKGQKYIDATVGGGGHSEQILKAGGKLLGIDRDPDALAFSRKRLASACPPSASSWKLALGNFAHLKKIAKEEGFLSVSGILFDLGLSCYQLLHSKRGFSFQEPSFLDMRMDPDLGVTAYDLVNHLSRKKLEKLFGNFGQERHSRKIAQAIVSARHKKRIRTAQELGELIKKTVPRKGRLHPATQAFMALRIVVNSELDNLKQALPQAISCLKNQGRLVVISFHSLEDSIVKSFFKKNKQELKILTVKPVVPSSREIRRNQRSRSARLRAAEKKI